MPQQRTQKNSSKNSSKRPEIKNKIIICLDSSGSMQSIAKPTVKAFNNILESIKANTFSSGQDTTLTLYTFGEHAHPVLGKFYDVPIARVPEMADTAYRPDGGTPMFDCIGIAINSALAYPIADDNTSFVMNIITDGYENESRTFDAYDIKQLLRKVQATDRWTVTFSVPPGAKRNLVADFGIPAGNVDEWDATAEGVTRSARSHSTSYDQYFANRTRGETKTDGFFVTDMSKIKTATVKRELTNVAKLYVALRVPSESGIRPFVEKSGFTYVKGNAYYQLTKDEEVQHYKKILLREKGKAAVYGGVEARDLLGLPSGLNVKVRPGNHANWDIFIQSTSVNRKLVRGTTLLYAK